MKAKTDPEAFTIINPKAIEMMRTHRNKEIAEAFGMEPSSISYWRKKLGIPIPTWHELRRQVQNRPPDLIEDVQ